MTAGEATPSCDVFIALGSNLGDRAATLNSAIEALRKTDDVAVVAVSPWIETDPVGPAEQPPYLNGAARLNTTLTPGDLLDRLLSIERDHGRRRDLAQRWGPRTLDLDLLLFGDRIIDEPGLTVPHRRMHERAFVLEPLNAIAPDIQHPVLGRTIADLLADLTSGVDPRLGRNAKTGISTR